MGSDSEVEDNEFEQSSDVEEEEEVHIDDDLFEAVEAATSEASEMDHQDYSEDDDEEDEEDDEPPESRPAQQALQATQVNRPPVSTVKPLSPPDLTPKIETAHRSFTPPDIPRPLSPAALRRANLINSLVHPKSYTVEAICAIPHPTPTHALASSFCLSHLFTGSQDGYVRDYDIFSAVNSKNFLTSAQRSHCGVIEGTMKAGQIRYWWENPKDPGVVSATQGDDHLAPIYSMASHSDAVWTLTGSMEGRINLFTARHDPGRLIHTWKAHAGPVSTMAVALDEKSFFSGGWDGSTLQWDLNTGQIVRNFTAHGAQISAVAVRPLYTPSSHRSPSPVNNNITPATVHMPSSNDSKDEAEPMEMDLGGLESTNLKSEFDVKSDNYEFDDLFDEQPEMEGENKEMVLADEPIQAIDTQPDVPLPLGIPTTSWAGAPAVPTDGPPIIAAAPRLNQPVKLAPKMPPLLDASNSPDVSPDLLMTASIDGQVVLWDRRVSADSGRGVGRLTMNSGTPPWCVSACWSATGTQVYAGRRNGTIDVWDVRHLGDSGPKSTPRLLKTIRNPISSGMVARVVGFPDGKHIACASNDNIRLWNVAEAGESAGRGAQFKIIPGHHGGFVSELLVDPAARFLISASSDRGWGWGESSRTIFVHDVKHIL